MTVRSAGQHQPRSPHPASDIVTLDGGVAFPASTEADKRTHSYEVGDVAYWSPGPDVTIYYRHDDQEIPNPGIIVIGKVDSGVETLSVPGSVRVTVELAR